MLKRTFDWIMGKPAIPEEEIPHYPPFAKGLPAVRASKLLDKHGELLEQLQEAVMFKKSVFDELVMPVVERYAAFVHLLPASEAHHHRGAGGLLHHGLEVAFLATRASEDVLFGAREVPQRRLELEPRWRLAVCMAGLIHDIGKPASDVSVTDSTGGHQWDCFSQSIDEWATERKIDRYFLHWQPNRHGDHEMMSTLVLDRVLTTEVRTYLGSMGSEVVKAMMRAVLHMETDHGHIGRLIRHADSASVERDLRRFQNPIDVSLGVPVERYLVDSMRRLVKSGKWRINEKGARLWLLDGELYVVWHAAAEEIGGILRDDRIPGVPRDPDSMADVLIDRALAVPRETERVTYRFWPMRPELFGDNDPHRLMMLRLSSPELLLDAPPPSISAQIVPTRADKKSGAPQAEAADKPGQTDKPEPSKGKAKAEKKRNSQPALEPVEIPRVNESESPTATPQPSDDVDESLAMYDDWASQHHALEDNEPDLSGVENQPSATTTSGPEPAPDPTPAKPTPVHFDAGYAEGLLRVIYTQANWTDHLFMHNGHVVIAYPEGAALAATPAEVQRLLGDEGLVVPDPMSSLVIVRIFNGRKGIMLDARRSAIFLEATSPGDAVQAQDAPAIESAPADPEVEAVTADRGATPEQPSSAEQGSATRTKNGRRRKRKKRGNSHPANDAKADVEAPQETAHEEKPADLVQACATDFIEAVRTPGTVLNRKGATEDGWIYVPQYAIAKAVSDSGEGRVSSADLRSALLKHPDVRVIGSMKLAVRIAPNG